MGILQHGAAIPKGGFPDYDIDHSIKFESDNTESLTKSQTASNRRTWTYSFWFKKTDSVAFQYLLHSNVGSGSEFDFVFNGGTDYRIADHSSGTRKIAFYSTVPLNDTAAWYHVVIACDTTQGTAANRFKVYLNGVDVTAISGYFSTAQYPDQNYETNVNNSSATLSIGKSITASTNFRGYVSEFHFVDGTMKDADDFGRYDSNGVWIPKEYTGAHGNEGYYLDFADAGDLGDDESGNGKDFTENNITAIDQAQDTPTNNFCTMNQNSRTNGNIRTQEGGTKVSTDGGSGWCSMKATMGFGAGKWYWEAKYHDDGDCNGVYIGVAPHNDPWIPARQGGYYLGNVETGGSMGWYLDNGANKNQNGSWGNPSRGDKLMIAYDADNHKLYYGINGSWGNSANPANGTGSVTSIEAYWMSGIGQALDFIMPAVSVYQGEYMRSFNFGGVCSWSSDIASSNADANGYGRFEYAPPSGFYAICTKNLAQYG